MHRPLLHLFGRLLNRKETKKQTKGYSIFYGLSRFENYRVRTEAGRYFVTPSAVMGRG
jgi:hypothetical protein